MNFLNKKIMPRYFLVTLALALAGVSVVAKAVYTMTVDRDRWIGMSRIQVREGRTLPAKRGNILACDGQILAASLPQYKVFIDYMSCERDSLQKVKDQKRRDSVLYTYIDEICAGLHGIFPDIDPAKMRKHLLEGRKKESKYWPVYVDEVTSLKLKRRENRQISYVEYSEVKKLPLFNLKSSINYEKIDMRKRPYGDLARRTIGDFKDSARHGLEMTFDTVLAGKPGVYHFQKVMNRMVEVIDTAAVDGCDVLTTLDVNMQDICEKALREKLEEINAVSGVCVLMEVATGDIKAMTGLSRRSDGTYHEDAALPVTDLYEPGSVFKPMSFLVAMDDGLIGMEDFVNVGNGIHEFGTSKMKDHNWRSGGYGTLTVPQIIAKSSNVGVSVLIDKHYRDCPQKFVDGLYRIGVAEDLQIPIPGYKKPRIRGPKDRSYWARTALPWMSIGYETQNVPVNTLNFYNSIANNGKMLRPRLVKAILRDGQVVKEFPVHVLREQMARPEAVANIRTCLETVITNGVGKAAGSKLFSVAGKTGTAQIWTGKGRSSEYFISFAGYFPADRPQYSCIVCIRKPAPASGGGMCGPVFKRVAEAVMAQKHVADYSRACDTLKCKTPVACDGNLSAARRTLARLSVPCSTSGDIERNTPVWGRAESHAGSVVLSEHNAATGTVPDVTGYGLRDAVCLLEGLGLRVTTEGVGTVSRQSLHAGTSLSGHSEIHLTLGHAKAAPAQPKADSASEALTADSAAAPDVSSVTTPAEKKPAAEKDKPAAAAHPAGEIKKKKSN